MKCSHCKKEIEGIQHICAHCNMPIFIDKETIGQEKTTVSPETPSQPINNYLAPTLNQKRISQIGKWLCRFFYTVVIIIMIPSFTIIHAGTDGTYSRNWGAIFSYALPLIYFGIAGSPLKYNSKTLHLFLYVGLTVGFLILGKIFIEPLGFVNFRSANIVGADVSAYSSAQYFIYNLECIIIFLLYFITHVFHLKDYINRPQKIEQSVITMLVIAVTAALILGKIAFYIPFMQQFSFWLINTYFG